MSYIKPNSTTMHPGKYPKKNHLREETLHSSTLDSILLCQVTLNTNTPY